MTGHESVIDWLWLQEAVGVAANIDALLEYFGSPGEIRNAGEYEWRLSGIISSKLIDRFEKASVDSAKRVAEVCIRNDWQIITPDSEVYPNNLRRLANRPAALYVMGKLEDWSERAILAVVGAREASPYGRAVAYGFGKQFAQAGAVTVSGGALGIDSAAHRGAVDSGGKTVAFLGCGFGTGYLRDNEELRRRIAENGAVVTELSPHTEATRYSFPTRNRLISGMSNGTVVIEAGEKSGSLITARYAEEQGRDVFAVPGDIVNSSFTGANKLIHNGAKAVFSGLDVLEEYEYLYPDSLCLSSVEPLDLGGFAEEIGAPEPRGSNKRRDKKVPKKQKALKAPPEDEEQLKIYNMLLEEEVLHIDEIALKLSKRTYEVLPVLTRLELSGCITIDSGRLCRIKSE